MKRTLAVLTAFILAIAFSGCQATPGEPVVVQKDLEQMIEKAQATRTPSSGTIAQRLGTQEHIRPDNVTNAQGTLAVITDADVSAPDAERMPMVRVTRHAFTLQDAERITDALFEGQPTYSGDILLSKQYYGEQILEFQRQLANETNEENRKQIQGSIDKFNGVMDTLPEGEGLVETPPEFTEQNGTQSMYLVSDGTDGNYRTLTVSNNAALGAYALCYLCGRNGYVEQSPNFYDEQIDTELRHGREAGGIPESIPEPGITAEQARQTADDLAGRIGMGDFACRVNSLVFGLFDGQWIKAYALEYTRQIDGVPINYVNASAEGAVDDGKGGYIRGWGYERLSFIVGDSGVLRMELCDPYDLGETVTADTTLLTFDSIMDTYLKMIVVINAYTDMSAELGIDKITLGLARITDSSTREAGLIVPAWDFFGRLKVVDESGEASVMDDPAETRLTLNAIDGTVIDRNLGH